MRGIFTGHLWSTVITNEHISQVWLHMVEYDEKPTIYYISNPVMVFKRVGNRLGNEKKNHPNITD